MNLRELLSAIQNRLTEHHPGPVEGISIHLFGGSGLELGMSLFPTCYHTQSHLLLCLLHNIASKSY